MQEHVIRGYEALAQVLASTEVTAKVDTAEECLLVEVSQNTAVRVFHPDIRVEDNLHGCWFVEYGHSRDDRQRGLITGRPAVSFDELAELVRIAIRLTQVRAFPMP